MTLVASAAIAFFTLRPGVGAEVSVPCCSPSDVLLNLLLFLPLGIGFILLGLGLRRSVLLAGLISIAIETAQLWIPGRDSAGHDVVANTLGALVGSLLAGHWSSRSRWWRIAGPVLSLGLVMFWVAASKLVQPSRPPNGRLWKSEWRPLRPGFVPFSGRLVAFEIQGMPLPEGISDESGQLLERMARADTVRIRVGLVAGEPMHGQSLIAGLYAGSRRDWVFMLRIRDRDLLVSTRLAGENWRLRGPVLRFPNALPTAGESLTVAMQITKTRLRASAQERPGGVGLTLRPSLAWSAFLPFEFDASSDSNQWPTVLSLGVYLLMGLGLSGRPGLLAAAGLVSMLAGPLITRGPFVPVLVMVGGAVALVLGSWLGRLLGVSGSSL